MNEINPWKSTSIDDYQKLFDEFGISPFDEFSPKYLFSWEGIPGNDNGMFIEFLRQNYGIDWVKTAKIEKIDDGKTINISAENNNISLKLNDEQTELNLEINDVRTDKFVVKIENNKLKIYLQRIKHPHRFMRRGIIFGHRSYDSIVDAMDSGKPFSAMSGFMPSGRVHLGHKMVMEEIIWHQQQGGTVFMAVADMEAHSVRGISWEDCRRIGVEEYILSLIALGFEPEGGRIYFQSTSPEVRDLAFELGVKANFSEMSAIYGFNGETNIAHMVSATVQSADILHPQLQEFGGPRPVVIPVGADQDPHIRLTRGLADKMNMFHVFDGQQPNPYYSNDDEPGKNKEPHVWLVNIYSKLPAEELVKLKIKNAFIDIEKSLQNIIIGNDEINRYTGHINIRCFSSEHKTILEKAHEIVKEVEKSIGGYTFLPPASTYHKFMTGLQGGKMSSSIPESIIALTEEPKAAGKKVMRAKTGGRMTLEEQKEHGGLPDECTVYELMLYHLVEDDNEVLEVKQQCLAGKLMCGTCKKRAAGLMEEFLIDHQRKREAAKERLPEFGIDYNLTFRVL